MTHTKAGRAAWPAACAVVLSAAALLCAAPAAADEADDAFLAGLAKGVTSRGVV